MVSSVHISPMASSEIPQIVDLWNEATAAQGEGYERHVQSSKRLGRIVSDPNFLPEGALVARQAGELVGFVLGYVQTVDFLGKGNLETAAGRLAGIAVRPDRWRQGIGQRLLEAVEEVLAAQGKSAISFSLYHAMPLALIHCIHADTVPHRFLKACGYDDMGPELLFYQDTSHFELQEAIVERRKQLEGEGMSFRWYRPEDRVALLEFVGREFSAAWYGIMQRAVSAQVLPEILLAWASSGIVGFIGPFDIGERVRFYFTTDARPGWGSFGSPGVARALRQRGIGTVLWHLGLDHLRRSGTLFTEYGTSLDNPARHLYVHSGADVIGIGCVDMRKRLV